MIKQLIIFLVFGGVMPNRVFTSSAVFRELSKEALASLDEFQQKYVTSASETSEAIYYFYNKLDNLTAQSNLTTELTPVFSKLKKAVELSFVAALIFGEETCASGEAAKNASGDNLDEAFTAIINTLELVQAGTYSKNKADVEAYQNLTETRIARFAGNLFDWIRSCANKTGDFIETALKTGQSELEVKLVGVAKIIYEAIGVYGLRTSRDTSKSNATASVLIDSYRAHSLDGVVNSFQHIFSLSEGFYLDNHLNLRSEIWFQSYITLYGRKVISYKLEQIIKVIFNEIRENFSKCPNALGLVSHRADDILTINSTEDAVVAEFQAANRFYQNVIALTQSNYSVKSSVTNLTLPLIMPRIFEVYYTAISIAQNKTFVCSNIPLIIGTLKNTQDQAIKFVVETAFAMIRNNETTALEIEPRISKLKRNAVNSAKKANRWIFAAIEFATEISCGIRKTASHNDVDKSLRYRKLAISAADDFSEQLFYGNLIEVILNYE